MLEKLGVGVGGGVVNLKWVIRVSFHNLVIFDIVINIIIRRQIKENYRSNNDLTSQKGRFPFRRTLGLQRSSQCQRGQGESEDHIERLIYL